MNSLPVPPRFVPTLTEVVPPTSLSAPTLAETGATVVLSAELEDQMMQRVLQRIDLILERRLQEAVGQLILAHTQTLAIRLREEIEGVVRQSVSEAFEQELTVRL